MNILLIGSGGREHAIAHRLIESDSCKKLYAYPGNPGILNYAEYVDLDGSNVSTLVFCVNNSIDLVVIGPEQPLANGIVDLLAENGVTVFGPTKFAAQLESSKGFAKDFMMRNNIPTASYGSFIQAQREDAKEYVINHSLPIVIKADGLAAGKGVYIADNHKEALRILDDIFDGQFGSAGNKVVIEEFLQGEEASVFAVCDGKDYFLLHSSQDHKRIGEGDTGLNTGGMGAYSPAKIVNEKVLEQVEEEIIKPVLFGMENLNYKFIGCLYCGLMIKDGKAKVVEFNARFGDPETQVVLSLLEGDFAKLLYSAAKGEIDKSSCKLIENKSAATVILASEGYPENYEKGKLIEGIDKLSKDVTIYHSGTKESEGKLYTNGGRVLAVTAKDESLQSALNRVYDAINIITFDGKYFRKDIGKKAL